MFTPLFYVFCYSQGPHEHRDEGTVYACRGSEPVDGSLQDTSCRRSTRSWISSEQRLIRQWILFKFSQWNDRKGMFIIANGCWRGFIRSSELTFKSLIRLMSPKSNIHDSFWTLEKCGDHNNVCWETIIFSVPKYVYETENNLNGVMNLFSVVFASICCRSPVVLLSLPGVLIRSQRSAQTQRFVRSSQNQDCCRRLRHMVTPTIEAVRL